MKLIKDNEYYSKMPTRYGYDAYGNKLEAPKGYTILKIGERLKEDDMPFDIYAGWCFGFIGIPRCHDNAYNEGRWTTWARKCDQEELLTKEEQKEINQNLSPINSIIEINKNLIPSGRSPRG